MFQVSHKTYAPRQRQILFWSFTLLYVLPSLHFPLACLKSKSERLWGTQSSLCAGQIPEAGPEAKRVSAKKPGSGTAGQWLGAALHLASWLGGRCCHGNCQPQQRPQRAQEKATAVGFIMAIGKAAASNSTRKYSVLEKHAQMRAQVEQGLRRRRRLRSASKTPFGGQRLLPRCTT